VPVSSAEAWQFLARVEDWPRWAAHIRRIHLIPPGEIGPSSFGCIHLQAGIRATFRVTEFEPGKSWKWVGPFLWLTVHYDHRFDAVAPTQTRLTWIVDAEGFGSAVVGRLFIRSYSKNLDRAILRLVEQIKACANN